MVGKLWYAFVKTKWNTQKPNTGETQRHTVFRSYFINILKSYPSNIVISSASGNIIIIFYQNQCVFDRDWENVSFSFFPPCLPCGCGEQRGKISPSEFIHKGAYVPGMHNPCNLGVVKMLTGLLNWNHSEGSVCLRLGTRRLWSCSWHKMKAIWRSAISPRDQRWWAIKKFRCLKAPPNQGVLILLHIKGFPKLKCYKNTSSLL